jgi:hypothetical protein
MAHDNGWDSYQKLVLGKLSDHSAVLESLDNKIQSIRTEDIPSLQIEIAMLKIKAGVWGAVAGVIPGTLAVVYIWLKHG